MRESFCKILQRINRVDHGANGICLHHLTQRVENAKARCGSDDIVVLVAPKQPPELPVSNGSALGNQTLNCPLARFLRITSNSDKLAGLFLEDQCALLP